jgi:RES domain-containing protein
VNLAAVSLLGERPENRIWYRATSAHYLPAAISTAHTPIVPSRFYDPNSASPQFPTLYLAEDALVAMFEAQALFGSPTTPGGYVSAPVGAWTVLTVIVRLDAVVDLSDVASQAVLDAGVQELTGDWRGFGLRSPVTAVTAPTGTAPTQSLGEAIHRDPRGLEGLITVSAKVPYHRNLIVFPDQLRATSFVEYDWTDSNGAHKFRIDQSNPHGTKLQ